MPEINLLEETKEGDGSPKKTPKKVPPAKVAYSAPESGTILESRLKKPSTFGLWIRSLFRGKAKGKPTTPAPPALQPGAPPPRPTIPPGAKEKPQDIFADIPPVSGGPGGRPRPKPIEPRPPSGSRPGEFPPLPSIPPMGAPRPRDVPAPSPLRPLEPRRGASAVPPQPRPPPIPPRPKLRIPGLRQVKGAPAETETDLGGVNLLPAELATGFEPQKRLTLLGLIAAAAALFVGIVYVSLILWKETQVRKTEEKRAEVQEVIARIKSFEKEQRQAILFKQSNDVIRQLLNKHVYWTKFFSLIEQSTLPTVFYPGGITVDLSGQLTLTGLAPDLETITKQLAIYQGAKDFVKTAKIEAVSRVRDARQGSGFNFIADLTFQPDVFYRPLDASAVEKAAESTPGTNANVNANANASP